MKTGAFIGLSIGGRPVMTAREFYGRVRDGCSLDDSQVIAELRIHFDYMCQKYPKSALVEMTVTFDGDLSGFVTSAI